MAIFFIILAIIILPILLIFLSTLRINLKKLELVNKEVTKFQLNISLALFNKINWLNIKLDKKRIEKLKINVKKPAISKFIETKLLQKNENMGRIIAKNWKQILSPIELEKIDFNLKLGTEDACLTAYTIGIISALVGITLARKAKRTKYLIEPIYANKNCIYLSINCIIAIKLVHIINIRKVFKEKEVYQEYGKSSNRRSYANSNG